MKLAAAATLASLLVHPIPIDDWEPPSSLLTGCVRSGNYTNWTCTGLGPAARAGMPDTPPPPVKHRRSALDGVPAALRAAAKQLDAGQINAARAAIVASLARLDEAERNRR